MIRLRLLFAFLCLPVDGEPDPPTDDAAPPPEEAGTGDDTLDDLIDAVDTTPRRAPAADDENPIVKEARERADRAERELAELRARPPAAPAPVADRDPEYDREEASLAEARRSGADDTTIRWMQWQVDQNRRTRESTRTSTQALRTAEDIADRSAFDRLEITKPAVYKRYAARVEQAVADARAKGQNAPRLAVLRLLIGDDIMNGKIKPKTRAATTAAPAGGVDRGRTPGVRTDVRPGKGSTESEKRRARLANTPI